MHGDAQRDFVGVFADEFVRILQIHVDLGVGLAFPINVRSVRHFERKIFDVYQFKGKLLGHSAATGAIATVFPLLFIHFDESSLQIFCLSDRGRAMNRADRRHRAPAYRRIRRCDHPR